MKLKNILKILLPATLFVTPMAFASMSYLWVNLYTKEKTFGKLGITKIVATPDVSTLYRTRNYATF